MIHAVVLHHDRAAIIELPKEPVELENHLRHLSVETGFSKMKRAYLMDH